MKAIYSAITIMGLLALTSTALADRINYSRNEFVRGLVHQQGFVQDQLNAVVELSAGAAKLVWVTSTEVGIREDLGLDPALNSGMKHKFIFEDRAQTIACVFSIYMIYQHTVPLSINKEQSFTSDPARCRPIN